MQWAHTLAQSMPEYLKIFNEGWRGWYDTRYSAPGLIRDMIIESKALCYNDLLHEAIAVKKKELSMLGGTPFYEPSTFYGSYKEAYYHDNAEGAGSRLASEIFSKFRRYRGHRALGPRELPEERSDYELKIWRISHPNPLSEAECALWRATNEVAEIEPWAWPIMIGLLENYYTPEIVKSFLPVVEAVQDIFIEFRYTEEEFYQTQKALWSMLQWDTARGM